MKELDDYFRTLIIGKSQVVGELLASAARETGRGNLFLAEGSIEEARRDFDSALTALEIYSNVHSILVRKEVR